MTDRNPRLDGRFGDDGRDEHGYDREDHEQMSLVRERQEREAQARETLRVTAARTEHALHTAAAAFGASMAGGSVPNPTRTLDRIEVLRQQLDRLEAAALAARTPAQVRS